MVEFGRDTEVKSQTCCSPLPYTQPYVTTQACHFGSRELDTRGSISATWSDARAPAIRKYGRLFRIRLRTKHLIAWTATFLLPFVGIMSEKGKVWERIVKKRGLYETKLEEITSVSSLNRVLHQEFQQVCSISKSRQFGWFWVLLRSTGMWVEKMRLMNLIPWPKHGLIRLLFG